jgi:hypothetical protein
MCVSYAGNVAVAGLITCSIANFFIIFATAAFDMTAAPRPVLNGADVKVVEV